MTGDGRAREATARPGQRVTGYGRSGGGGTREAAVGAAARRGREAGERREATVGAAQGRGAVGSGAVGTRGALSRQRL